MLLVIANEAFGYSHEQTLNMSFVLLLSMLRERRFINNERDRAYDRVNDDLKEGEDWVEITDFQTGKKKRVKRVKSV